MRREVYIIIHADGEEIYDFKPVRNGLHNKDLGKEDQLMISKKIKEVDRCTFSGWAFRERLENDGLLIRDQAEKGVR